MGPQLVREGGCTLQSAIFMLSVGVPSCVSSDFPGDAEKGLEWQSDSYLSVLEQPKTEVRNEEEGLVNSGTVEGCHFCPMGFEIRCRRRS